MKIRIFDLKVSDSDLIKKWFCYEADDKLIPLADFSKAFQLSNSLTNLSKQDLKILNQNKNKAKREENYKNFCTLFLVFVCYVT